VHAYVNDRYLAEKDLQNYWGYNTLGFFAPEMRYSASDKVKEFKTMVRTMHSAGIEVIIDVVYNHSCEGNQLGPTLSMRGIDNSTYYALADDRRYYADYTGCGNSLNLENPRTLQLVMDSLRYWVEEMHVDGFRFDLASTLAREGGVVDHLGGFFDVIRQDPVLNRVKLIAEPWDLGWGGYQVGNFPPGWAEWNDRYRDGMRCYWKGDGGQLGEFARRICGSADLYQDSGKGPAGSLNFVTCHDGFTLNDLVSYTQKHNDENGEFGRDGSDANYSENCGVEGPSEDPVVEGMRCRLIKNYLLTLFVSRGVPMLLGGDEFRRTQRGNNNAYCQDNEVSWFDWRRLEEHKEIHRFTRGMIAFRRAHPVLRKESFYTDADIKWFGANGATPDWADQRQKSFACLVSGEPDPDLFLMFNAGGRPIDFSIPALPPGKAWRFAVDTSRTAPDDLFDAGKEPLVQSGVAFRLEARSSAILITTDGLH